MGEVWSRSACWGVGTGAVSAQPSTADTPAALGLDPDTVLQRHPDAIARWTLALVAAGTDLVRLLTDGVDAVDSVDACCGGTRGQAGASSPATRRAVATKAGAVTSTLSR